MNKIKVLMIDDNKELIEAVEDSVRTPIIDEGIKEKSSVIEETKTEEIYIK